MPETLIVTTTYKRPELIEHLKDSIDPEGVHWLIWDDGSPEGMYEGFVEQLPSWATYFRSKVNRGKKEYWRTIDFIFKRIRNIDFNYCIFIPDDAVFTPNGQRKALQDLGKRKVLSLHNDQPERLKLNNWGRIPKDQGTHWSDGFIDMLFIARKDWFQAIAWKCRKVNRNWAQNPHLGSGVGAQLTRASYRRGIAIDIGKGDYIIRDHTRKSVMNPK